MLVQGQVNRNFQLVLNEMGPGRTNRHGISIALYTLPCKKTRFEEAKQSVETVILASGRLLMKTLLLGVIFRLHPFNSLVGAHNSYMCRNKTFEPCHEKICLRWFANNKGADQPAHPCSLIRAFVFHVLKVSYPNMLQAIFQLSN